MTDLIVVNDDNKSAGRRVDASEKHCSLVFRESKNAGVRKHSQTSQPKVIKSYRFTCSIGIKSSNNEECQEG